MKNYFFLFQLLISSICYSQSPHPLEFFPHQPGDLWQMRSCYDLSLVSSLEVDKDSVDSNGNIYIKYKQYEGYSWIIDTSFSMYWDFERIYCVYKLNAAIGDTWTFHHNFIARVVDVYPDTLWSIPTIVKKIEYWVHLGNDSLWMETRYLASGFGLIKYDFEPGDCHFLAGCIIDSVRYGWLVDIKENEKIKTKFILYPNYPNPFNPTTKINYELPISTHVTLSIYNSLGQLVKTLVNHNQEKGFHEVYFDGNGLSSGLYICRLKAGGTIQSRKMILMK